jgi:phosphate starvation-inducible PhoH-like protein
MNEKSIEIESINPIDLFGVNDSNLNFIQSYFPKIKMLARGNAVKIAGEERDVNLFTAKFNLFVNHFNKYNSLTPADIKHIMDIDGLDEKQTVKGENGEVLVFGNNGLLVKARTPNQRLMVSSIAKSDMLFAVGPAGTGKTYTAVAIAVRALKNKEVRKIILTRPAVEAGENLGFLPGDLKEKLDPYLQPLYDALRDMIPPDKLAAYIESRVIEIAPLAFMRGRTLDNAFVILDEAQNATQSQLRMFLTRMGKSAKFIITGDVTQIDLPRNQPSGLIQASKLLDNIKGIDFVQLDTSDVIRHKLVKDIIEAYDKQS